MREISIFLFGLLTLLFCCKTKENKASDEFPIPDPRLVDFDTSDNEIKRATIRAKEYLTRVETGTEISKFYLDSLYKEGDTIVLWINHADYYVQWRLMKEAERRLKELEENGEIDTEPLEIPPNGNWSGKDRAIYYLTKKDSVVDLLVQ